MQVFPILDNLFKNCAVNHNRYLELSTSSAKAPNKNSCVVLRVRPNIPLIE